MSTTVIFHIYINGKDVSIKTTSQDCTQESAGSDADPNRGVVESCGEYRGGGKKPPYFCSPLFYPSREQIDESDPDSP